MSDFNQPDNMNREGLEHEQLESIQAEHDELESAQEEHEQLESIQAEHDELSEDSQGKRKGDLSIALRKEREAKRALESQHKQMQAQLEQYQQMLQAFSNNRQPQQPQMSPEERRQLLAEKMLEDPEAVLRVYGETIQKSLRSEFESKLRAQSEAAHYKTKFAERYPDIVKHSPEILESLLAHGQNPDGTLRVDEIEESLAYFYNLVNKVAKTAQPKAVNKSRASSTVGRQAQISLPNTREEFLRKKAAELGGAQAFMNWYNNGGKDEALRLYK